jgi:hypothetical protein
MDVWSRRKTYSLPTARGEFSDFITEVLPPTTSSDGLRDFGFHAEGRENEHTVMMFTSTIMYSISEETSYLLGVHYNTCTKRVDPYFLRYRLEG